MESLDPDKLTPQKTKDALGMIGAIVQEKCDHTPKVPNLKYLCRLEEGMWQVLEGRDGITD
jgi:hypothetical protein